MSRHSIAWQYSLSFFEVFLPGLLMLICFAFVTQHSKSNCDTCVTQPLSSLILAGLLPSESYSMWSQVYFWGLMARKVLIRIYNKMKHN